MIFKTLLTLRLAWLLATAYALLIASRGLTLARAFAGRWEARAALSGLERTVATQKLLGTSTTPTRPR